MIPHHEARRLRHLVSTLGKMTPDQIATWLQNNKIRGTPMDACNCPVARAVRQQFPEYQIMVNQSQITLFDHEQTYVARNSSNLRAFIGRFDRDLYPRLVSSR